MEQVIHFSIYSKIQSSFGLLVLMAMSPLLIGCSIKMVVYILNIESWVKTPCKTVEMESIMGERVTVFGQKKLLPHTIITYSYVFNGVEYNSDFISIYNLRLFGYKYFSLFPTPNLWMLKHLRIFEGTKIISNTCWVNPQNPSEAMLSNNFSYVLVLLPLAIGIGLLIFVYFLVRTYIFM